MGEVKKCLLIGPGKPVEVKEGGKISITLGLLINITYNVKLFFTWLKDLHSNQSILSHGTDKMTKYFCMTPWIKAIQ